MRESDETERVVQHDVVCASLHVTKASRAGMETIRDFESVTVHASPRVVA